MPDAIASTIKLMPVLYIGLIVTSIVLLNVASVNSVITLLNNLIHLNLNDAALGILSTLNIPYFIGLISVVISYIIAIKYLDSANTLVKILPVLLALLYLTGYPLLLSRYPPYLGDGTLYSSESLMVSLFGYNTVKSLLYNNGAYPLAFIWNAMLSKITEVQPIRLSSIYGFLEPLFLSLVAYIATRRLYNSNSSGSLNAASLSMLIYVALIWSYQFHFSPQDFNVIVLMLSITPLLPMVAKGDVGSIGLLGLITLSLTLGHQTETPILIASLLALLLLKLIRRTRVWPIILSIFTVAIMMFISYSIFVFPVNIGVISDVFSMHTIERLINLLIGRVTHAVFFAISSPSVYPLRLVVYKYELHGGYAMALFEAIASVVIYMWLLLRGNNDYHDEYASITVGGLVVIVLITLALGTYSNRVTIYVAPILSGFLATYIWRFTHKFLTLRYVLIFILFIFGFMGLMFSGSTIYWDYSAGNPVTWTSYGIIYSLGYHCNVATYYVTGWLTGYELLMLTHSINYQCTYQLFDFNKNDLLYLANDVDLKTYHNALAQMMKESIIYNDNLNMVAYHS